MSGDARNEMEERGRLIAAVEQAAEDLAKALLETGDKTFRVNPQAIIFANEHLTRRTGLRLVQLK